MDHGGADSASAAGEVRHLHDRPAAQRSGPQRRDAPAVPRRNGAHQRLRSVNGLGGGTHRGCARRRCPLPGLHDRRPHGGVVDGGHGESRPESAFRMATTRRAWCRCRLDRVDPAADGRRHQRDVHGSVRLQLGAGVAASALDLRLRALVDLVIVVLT
ncbi:hypothetical protein PLANTIT3_50235 [Plantibacter sp. T3]|nr:hypothetical protein PLANTIT3_50235 [Plantibacter sp. T3]